MMLRRLKEDVEKNLARKEETIIEVGLILMFIIVLIYLGFGLVLSLNPTHD